MTPAQLSAAIRDSIRDAVAAGDLSVSVPDTVSVRRSAHSAHQWSSNAALKLGDPRAPQVVAQRLRRHDGIAAADVAGPGLLNVTVDAAELARVASAIVNTGTSVANSQTRRDHAWVHPVDDATAHPVHPVQFAHGRLCSLAAQAASHGVTRSAFVPEMLCHETETALLMALAEYEDVSRVGDAQALLQHLSLIAETFQACFAATRHTPRGLYPVTDLHRTRLWLSEATRIVLSNGLHQLGLTAPEHI